VADRSECPRCKRGPLVAGRIVGTQEGRVEVGPHHTSPLKALVCTSCGHIQLVATDPHALRPDPGEEPPVQESDF